MFFEKDTWCMSHWIWHRYAYGSITSNNRLVIFNWHTGCGSWLSLACLLEKIGGVNMKIVVKKVPKFLRGFVKLIFGIKD